MRQIVLKQPGEFVAIEVARPALQPGHALVRVRRIGVCGSDLHAFAGRQPFFSYPRVLGHELGIEVLAVAPDGAAPADRPSIKPGDRCAVEPYLSCGTCRVCRRARYNCCERLQVLGVHTDGGMLDVLSVPTRLLHKSDRLTCDQLALVETLGIGAHAVRRSELRPGEEVLVVGAGPIGLAVVQFALAASGKVRVLEMNPARREFVKSLGVTASDAFDGQPAEVVFDATGNPSAMQESFQAVAHGGRLVFVGLVLGNIALDDPLFHRREMTLLASRNSCHEFPRIIRMIEEGRIDTKPWITHRLVLGDVPRDFAALGGTPGLVKAMIEVDDVAR